MNTRSTLIIHRNGYSHTQPPCSDQRCEFGNKCNEYVCLVLHSPGPTVDGAEREVQCDYIRIWSTVGTCANFHHQALHDIYARYKAKIPGLKRLRVWSDGHGSTYKGRDLN